MTLHNLLFFLLGSLIGATGMGFLAIVMHRRFVEMLSNEHASRIAAARRKAYAQGYEHRAALEFAPTSQNQ